MARRYGGEITFLGVAWRDSTDAMQAFVEGFGMGFFPHIADVDEEFFDRFGVPYQPAWVFIDSRGNVARSVGALPESDLSSILGELAQDHLPTT